MERLKIGRRGILKGAAALAAAAAVTRYNPGRAFGGPNPAAPIKRVIILYAPGGLRWLCTFDGRPEHHLNPWGLLPASAFGAAPLPEWGFGRMLMQKPLPNHIVDWDSVVEPYLASDDPNDYNFNRVQLTKPGWAGKTLPTMVDIASEIAVVRCTADPTGTFDNDHNSATGTLQTGFRSGGQGLLTAMNYGLQLQLGSAYDTTFKLPPVEVGNSEAWGYASGEFSPAQPVYLNGIYELPGDSGSTVAPWARGMENELDSALAQSRQAYSGAILTQLAASKKSGDDYGPTLANPALNVSIVGAGSPVLGQALDGTPVSNDMLSEVFGFNSGCTPAGDILFDLYAAQQDTSSIPVFDNGPGGVGAFVLRMAQIGAPIVAVRTGYNMDHHANEIIYPGGVSHPQGMLALARILTGLEFALKNVVDPDDPTKTMWDSTVVVLTSEFGRDDPRIGESGFNGTGASGGGTDHGPSSGWPLLGGPVSGGKLFTDAGGYYPFNRVFTSLMQGMGVSKDNSTYITYDQFPPIPGLVRGL